MSKKTYILIIAFCFLVFSTAFAQGNVDRALNNARAKAEAESKAKFDAKVTQAVDYAVSKNKSGITSIRPIESNPDAYILTIDGTNYLFTRPEDRNNAKDKFITNATKDAITKLAAIQNRKREYYEKTLGAEIKQKISNHCSISKGRNPNYKGNATPTYTPPPPFPTTPGTTVDEGGGNMTFITGSSTQYDNILVAPSARENTPVNPSADNPISVSFEGIGDYITTENKLFLNPVQKARELDKSKRAYEIAVDKINKFPEEKEKLEKETAMLITKNQNGQELIFQLQKDSARLEYQQHIVWHEASDFKYEGYIRHAENEVKERENTLKTQFGISEEDIQQLRKEAETALKKGVPTMTLLADLDKGDEELRENLPQKIQDALEVTDAGTAIGEPIAAGIIEMIYSNGKNEVSQTIEQYRKIEQRQRNEIRLKQQQLADMTTERNNLQKVLNKYGYDIVNHQDDYQIINFGNECRDALSIRIE